MFLHKAPHCSSSTHHSNTSLVAMCHSLPSHTRCDGVPTMQTSLPALPIGVAGGNFYLFDGEQACKAAFSSSSRLLAFDILRYTQLSLCPSATCGHAAINAALCALSRLRRHAWVRRAPFQLLQLPILCARHSSHCTSKHRCDVPAVQHLEMEGLCDAPVQCSSAKLGQF